MAHCQQMCGLHTLARAQPWRVTSVDSSQVISGMAQDEPVTVAEDTWWLALAAARSVAGKSAFPQAPV